MFAPKADFTTRAHSRPCAMALASFALLAGTVFSGPFAASAESRTLVFDVLRQGKPFGTHSVEIVREGNLERANIRIQLEVKIGPLTVFQLRHQCRETWADARLQELDCSTRKDGKTYLVSARAVADGYDIKGTGFVGRVNGPLLPSSHWRVAQARASQLLDTESGTVVKVNPRALGSRTIETALGPIVANAYAFDTRIPFTPAYDSNGRWVGMQFTARGQNITYRLKRAQGW